jgi:hypothetical protein
VELREIFASIGLEHVEADSEIFSFHSIVQQAKIIIGCCA